MLAVSVVSGILPVFVSCGAPVSENDNHRKQMLQLVANYIANNVDRPTIFIYPNDEYWGCSINTPVELYFTEPADPHANWTVTINGVVYDKTSSGCLWYNNNEILVINPATALPRLKSIPVRTAGFMAAYRPIYFQDQSVFFMTNGDAPTISVISPSSTSNVASNATFTLRFTDKPRQTNAWCVTIAGHGYTKSSPGVTWNGTGTELTIDPQTTYDRDAVFDVSTNDFIADNDGISFTQLSKTFHVASSPKASFVPANNATGIGINNPIVITFTEAMKPGNAWSVSVNGAVYTSVSPAISWSNNYTKLSILPNGGLPPLATVPVTLNGFNAAFDNAPLSGGMQITFVTDYAKEVIGTNINAYYEMKLLIDANNALHICYQDASIWKGIYGTNKSGAWQFEELGNDVSSIDMILDAEGNPHIFYLFHHFSKKHGVWVSERFGNGTTCANVSAAKDSNGVLHIVYANESKLFYTTNNTGTWNQTVLETGDDGYYSASMALDGLGNVHVAYRNQTGIRNLLYATNSGGTWQKTTIDGTQQVGGTTSIGVDSNNRVHISYYKYYYYPSNDAIKYVTNVSGSWLIRDIVEEECAGSPKLYIDSANNVYISVVNYINAFDALQVYTNKSGSWLHTQVDSANSFNSRMTSMAIDSNGRFHIIYSVRDSTLMHAYY